VDRVVALSDRVPTVDSGQQLIGDLSDQELRRARQLVHPGVGGKEVQAVGIEGQRRCIGVSRRAEGVQQTVDCGSAPSACRIEGSGDHFKVGVEYVAVGVQRDFRRPVAQYPPERQHADPGRDGERRAGVPEVAWRN
jgi:hypothetical protein